jgi:RimJ/RimL family protein N-acetyltransferase
MASHPSDLPSLALGVNSLDFWSLGFLLMSVRFLTERLELVLQTPEEVLAWVASMPPADQAEVSPHWIARVKTTKPGDFWALAFTVKEKASGGTVGGCAFKGPPDAEGMVEIAYGTDEAFRGKGYATEAALALVKIALQSGQVRLIRAHSRPDNAASARVLTKSGFQPMGEVIDPEDGLVVRWEHVEGA